MTKQTTNFCRNEMVKLFQIFWISIKFIFYSEKMPYLASFALWSGLRKSRGWIQRNRRQSEGNPENKLYKKNWKKHRRRTWMITVFPQPVSAMSIMCFSCVQSVSRKYRYFVVSAVGTKMLKYGWFGSYLKSWTLKTDTNFVEISSRNKKTPIFCSCVQKLNVHWGSLSPVQFLSACNAMIKWPRPQQSTDRLWFFEGLYEWVQSRRGGGRGGVRRDELLELVQELRQHQVQGVSHRPDAGDDSSRRRAVHCEPRQAPRGFPARIDRVLYCFSRDHRNSHSPQAFLRIPTLQQSLYNVTPLNLPWTLLKLNSFEVGAVLHAL